MLLISSLECDISQDAFIDTCVKWSYHPERIVKFLEGCSVKSDRTEQSVRIIHRVLKPRLKEKDPELEENVLIDAHSMSMMFIPVLPPNPTKLDIPIYYPKVTRFEIKYIEGTLQLWALPISPNLENKHLKQVANRLLRRMRAWCTNFMEPGGYIEKNLTDKIFSKEEYYTVYQNLKQKYKHWVTKWSAQTDAVKFVFEDISIAAYLITLWKQEHSKGNGPEHPKFIDFGCGNGFLVFLLTKEGYTGFGIDLHRRPMWEEFEDQVELKVQTFDPSKDRIDDDIDWVLGNHSDELTPWIPVLCHQSVKAKFWVLPCCFHDFYGKFKKPLSNTKGEGRYRLYLDYIKLIGEDCGFVMEEDGMRIPSTKNMCFVGRKRTFDVNDPNQVEIVNRLIEQRLFNEGSTFIPRKPPTSSFEQTRQFKR